MIQSVPTMGTDAIVGTCSNASATGLMVGIYYCDIETVLIVVRHYSNSRNRLASHWLANSHIIANMTMDSSATFVFPFE
jgi:hypothetical protein